MKLNRFFNLEQVNETPEGYLLIIGRMVDEGDINGDWFSYEELKKSIPYWTGKPITIEHEESVNLNPGNYERVAVGHILKALSHDPLKEILCQFVITTEKGIKAFKSGTKSLSIGFYFDRDEKRGNINIQPNHLSLVKDPARPRAKIIAHKQNILEESMDLEEMAKAILALSEEDYARLLSLIEEMSTTEANENEEKKEEDPSAVQEDEEKKALLDEIASLKAENEALKSAEASALAESKKASARAQSLSRASAKASLMSSGQAESEKRMLIPTRK